MKKLNLAVTLLAVITLSACTSATAPDDVDAKDAVSAQPFQVGSQPKAGTEPTKSSAVREYFDAFASQEAEPMRAAAEDAAEGSMAQDYLVHQANIAEAYDANGYSGEAQTADYDNHVVNVSSPDYTTKYADIKFDGEKVASFTIDGKDVSERLVVGDGEAVESSDGLVSFEVLSAYKSISDDLFVAVKYATDDRSMDFGYQASYRDPSGRQINDSDSVTPSTIVADSYQLGIVIFPGAEIGGTMQLNYGSGDDGEFVFGDVAVPLPEK